MGNGIGQIQVGVGLVEVCERDAALPDHLAAVRRFLPGQKPQQRRFAAAVRADNCQPLALFHLKRNVLEKHLAAVSFCQMLGMGEFIGNAEAAVQRRDKNINRTRLAAFFEVRQLALQGGGGAAFGFFAVSDRFGFQCQQFFFVQKLPL